MVVDHEKNGPTVRLQESWASGWLRDAGVMIDRVDCYDGSQVLIQRLSCVRAMLISPPGAGQVGVRYGSVRTVEAVPDRQPPISTRGLRDIRNKSSGCRGN